MTDVSCRALIGHLDFLQDAGISTKAAEDSLRARLAIPAEAPSPWSKPSNLLPWNDFASIMADLAKLYTPELERGFVDQVVIGSDGDWIAPIRPLFRLIVGSSALYWLVQKWAGPFNFRNIQSTTEALSGSTLKVSLTLRPEDHDLLIFFRLTAIMLEQIPRMIGERPAVMSATIGPRSGVYLIVLPPRRTFFLRMKRRFLAQMEIGTIFEELAERDRALHANQERLQQSQSELEEKVRRRTADLEESNRRLTTQIEALKRVEKIAQLGSWEWDLKTRGMIWTDETYRLFGIPVGTPLTAELVKSRIHPDDAAAVAAQKERTRLEGRYLEIEHRILTPDGLLRYVSERGEVIFGEDGKAARVIGTSRDITMAKQHERSLIEAKEVADGANRTKSTFLANVSHEIRTPMSSVLGFAELLSLPSVSPDKQRTYIEKILRNGRHLLALIDDVLDISKVESGNLLVQATRFSPQTEIMHAVDILRDVAESKGLKLAPTFDANLPEVIYNDAIRLRQILINIIGNAIKYTEQGEIKIVARTTSAGAIEIVVTDTGRGIAEEHHGVLFQPFSQATPSVLRAKSGSGIGLALARRLAKVLGGDVRLLRSAPGAGSTFVIEISALLAEDVRQGTIVLEHGVSVRLDASQLLGEAGARPRILIAEDNADIQDLVRRVLEAAGAEVTVTSNGVDCVRVALDRHPDLILMDMQMPELDGFAATTRLRSSGYLGPIVALTALAMTGERQRCLAAGCDDFLSKPVETLQLVRTVGKWAKPQARAP